MNLRNLAFALSLVLAAGIAPAAPPTATVEELARFPNGTFLENGEVDRDGALYFTSYFERRIYVYRRGQPPTVFAELPVHPVAVLLGPKDILVSAHGKPFTSGPEFTRSQQLLVLDRQGKVTRTTEMPEARFLNGMVRAASGVLVADSIAATVWRYDPASQAVTAWLKDEALSQDPGRKEFRPGANGLKLRGSTLFISNSSRGTLSTIELADDRPIGTPRRLAVLDGIDDFTIARDGSVFAASHAEAVYRVDPRGKVATVLDKGCGGCTAIFAVPSKNPMPRHFYVLTTGAMLEGGKAEAQVLQLSLR